MLCESPITLKSGIVVPCGKCLLCLSHRRDEWSVRLQLHALDYDFKPFFVTFTYDDDHLVYGDSATLYKRDFQLFIKRLKDRFNLYGSKFAFFAAGEYGDSFDRPHYHAILFGFDELRKVYDRSWLDATQLLYDVWQNGFVYPGVAETSGIHYTSKYVLKFATGDFSGIQKPFTLSSNGIGLPWLNTSEALYLKSRLDLFKLRSVKVPFLDVSDFQSLRDSAKDGLNEMSSYFPKMLCTLSNGMKVPIPSYLRKKLVGSFQHFTDNPFWIYESYRNIVNSCDYIMNYSDYDHESKLSHQSQLIDFAKRKIKQRLIINGKL